MNNFCVFILTHGRPDRVITWNTLRKSGYDGQVFLVVDNEDDSWQEYVNKFGAENVIFFDKRETAKRFDEFDNFDNRSTIVYARNECFEIARKLGYKYFLELDDDYVCFGFRMRGIMETERTSSWLQINYVLTGLFPAMVEMFEAAGAMSIAFSQGGDWMDGTGEGFSRRKCMNTFFCSTARPFSFVGRINEDVNTYTWFQSMGNLFLTIPFIQITQKQTQTNAGGMSSIYLNQGTYVKSFYTIICSPSCVKIKIMGSTNRRMHHKVDWGTAVPMIISEDFRKGERKIVVHTPPVRPRGLMTVAEINSLIELPPARVKPAAKPAKRPQKSKQLVTIPAAPKKEFDQDYWKKQGIGTDKPAWDISNLKPV